MYEAGCSDEDFTLFDETDWGAFLLDADDLALDNQGRRSM